MVRDFLRQERNGITAISRNILQLVRTHIAVLAEYGLSRETPEQLEIAIGSYEQAKPKVQKVRTETVNC